MSAAPSNCAWSSACKVRDAVAADLPAIQRIYAHYVRQGTATFAARTVHPSITAAAMTSLFTGVAPHVHGIKTDRFGLPRSSTPLTLLPRLLQQHGFPVHVFLHALPRAYRGLASRIGPDTNTAGARRNTFARREGLIIPLAAWSGRLECSTIPPRS